MGMLFDHGCDAFTVSFVISMFVKFINFGNNIHSVIWFAMCISLFYFAMLEEYYVGGMILGLGNPIDLSIGTFTLYICFGIWGNHWCGVELISKGYLFADQPSLNFVGLVFYGSGFLMAGNILYCIWKIFKTERFEGKGKDAVWYIVLY